MQWEQGVRVRVWKGGEGPGKRKVRLRSREWRVKEKKGETKIFSSKRVVPVPRPEPYGLRGREGPPHWNPVTEWKKFMVKELTFSSLST